MADLCTSLLTYEPGYLGYAEFPETDDPVWLLGTEYIIKEDGAEAVRRAFRSLLWFTYRRGFAAIDGEGGPTSDTGWGCMLRTGQMMLAQALVRRHLGRGWRWDEDPAKVPQRSDYLRLLRLFQDKKSATFSIHQVALMGQSDGKPVGEWFSPNTVAQALKRLVQYDAWSDLRVHVAMDNMVVLSDIKNLGRLDHPEQQQQQAATWRSIILVIPLRLGLAEMNPIYTAAVGAALRMRSSLGIIGGRPNHALYFVGLQGKDQLIFLDPHTTQNVAYLSDDSSSGSSSSPSGDRLDDSSYHCWNAQRMQLSAIDPSMALCFYLSSEADLDQWCSDVRSHLVDSSGQPLFEITEQPLAWSYDLDNLMDNAADMNSVCSSSNSFATLAAREGTATRRYDTSDEEFEIL